MGPVADEAELVAIKKPGGGLLDGGLLQIDREGGLTGSDVFAVFGASLLRVCG